MFPPQKLYILRHGQTNYNLQKIVQGRGINSDLNETGLTQAKAFFEHYKHLPFCAIYASNLKRTYQTIAHFETIGHEIKRFAELDEISWGDHEGRPLTPADKANYMQVKNDWDKGLFHISTQNGESPLDVQKRLQDFLDYLHQQKHESTLICTHGRTSRILLCMLLNQSLHEMDTHKHSNTSLAKLEWKNDKYELAFSGNVEHLEK